MKLSRNMAALLLALIGIGVPAWIALAAPDLGPTTTREPTDTALAAQPPRTLVDTGLYADPTTFAIRADALEFAPQYPLWTDGASKRRWIVLPEGAHIDASSPDAWRFPVGTKLWKEFAFGRRVETRYMELGADGAWAYASYVWNAAEDSAERAPERGVRGIVETTDGARHDIPARMDCLACHEATPTPVLGFSALQLSADRDPLAPHAQPASRELVDLDDLISRGLVRNLPATLAARLPRIAARSPRERAALGYLHGNCGGCHNAHGPLAQLGLDLAYSVEHGSNATRTALDAPTRYRSPHTSSLRLASGAPDESLLVQRMASRDPLLRMPAIGSKLVDEQALELLREWIANDLAPTQLSANNTPRR